MDLCTASVGWFVHVIFKGKGRLVCIVIVFPSPLPLPPKCTLTHSHICLLLRKGCAFTPSWFVWKSRKLAMQPTGVFSLVIFVSSSPCLFRWI